VQTSPTVFGFRSSHGEPLGFGGFEQAPVAGSQLPASWHGSLAVQLFGLLPVQTPASQASVCVHAFASLQGVPFAFGGFEQTPVAVLHTPAS
jgi:hypothetical protein